MKKFRSLFVILLILCTLFLLSMNFTESKNQENVIKIGTLAPMAITQGIDCTNAAELAVEEINSAGGVTVGGTSYEFELVEETTSGPLGTPDLSVATANYIKLADQHEVVAVIGSFRIEVMLLLQLGGYLDRPFLGVGTTGPLISPYFWRVMPSNGTELTLAMLSLYNYGLIPLKNVRNITIFREDNMWTLSMSKALQFYIPYIAANNFGITVNVIEDIAVSEQATLTEVEAVLTDYKVGGSKDHVNALLTIFSSRVGRYATQAWYNLDLPQIMAGSNIESQASTFWNNVQGACYGEIVMESAPPGVVLTPTTTAFTSAYEAKASKYPTYTAFGTYESVYIIKEALERLSSYNTATITEDLQAELINTDYYGPRARIKFTSEPLQQGVNSTGDPVDIPGADVINGGMDVHDTWTSNGATTPPCNLTNTHVIFSQWQEGGEHTAIWGHAVLPAIFALKAYNPANPFDTDANYWSYYDTTGRTYCSFLGGHYPDDLRSMLNWNIFDHSNHGWEPEPTTTTEPLTETTETSKTETSTTSMSSSETKTTEPKTSESETSQTTSTSLITPSITPGFNLWISIIILVSLVGYIKKRKGK